MTDGSTGHAQGDGRSLVQSLCDATMGVTTGDGLDGIAVSRCARSWYAGVVFASDHTAGELESVQDTSGEGPGPMALSLRSPVLVDDISSDPVAASWVSFVPAAAELGVRSVFAFPVQIGAAGLGLLTLHGRAPVSVAETSVTEYLRLADAVAVALLVPGAAPQRHPDDLHLDDLLDSAHAVTHQAVGMVSVQIDGSLEDAMAALRARAFADGRRLSDIARAVVARRLSFREGEGKEPPENGGRPSREGRDDER